MEDPLNSDCSLALVGAGGFAHNVCHVLQGGGCRVEFFVDEIKSGSYMGRPVVAAADLDAARRRLVHKFVVAISQPEYREAAVRRLLAAGVPDERIIRLTDDQIIPIINLIFQRFGPRAAAFLATDQCRSVFDLERRFFGDSWREARRGLDPAKQTLAFCFYGRGGGFRRHIRGLIPRLKERFNLIALLDEDLPGEGFDIPELYAGPDTARDPGAMGWTDIDLHLTAHFIACSPDHRPKVNFLHTSFDFILDPAWITDRFGFGDPHYIFCSTRATYDWMRDLAARRPLKNRLCLIPGGYTRLDENLRHNDSYDGPVDSLVYAPTLSLSGLEHHDLTYSMNSGAEILAALLAAFPEHRVVFRPHPHDLQLVRQGRDDELAQPLLRALAVCEENERCELDAARTFYMDTYNRSAVMVSDTSSTAYTYALSTCRPVVFYSPRDEEVRGIYSRASAFIRDRERVGAVVSGIEDLVGAVGAMIGQADTWRDKVSRYRQEMAFNPGRAEEYFIANLPYILAGRRHPHWTYLNWDEPSRDPSTDG